MTILSDPQFLYGFHWGLGFYASAFVVTALVFAVAAAGGFLMAMFDEFFN